MTEKLEKILAKIGIFLTIAGAISVLSGIGKLAYDSITNDPELFSQKSAQLYTALGTSGGLTSFAGIAIYSLSVLMQSYRNNTRYK